MWGTIVNAAAILAGSLLGVMINKGIIGSIRITDRVKSILMQGIGLSVVMIEYPMLWRLKICSLLLSAW